ncbi:MAG: hypothetical protein IPN43_17065 [Chitinophagaceae bacterium]|nr:hypothetical protein [Chitinophagaceae bacterium]
MGQVAGFQVSAGGGTPQRVFGNYFFNMIITWLNIPQPAKFFLMIPGKAATRCIGKDTRALSILMFNLINLKQSSKKVYRLAGKDFGATIDRNGNIYFISDEANGEYNFVHHGWRKKKGLTRFSSSIKHHR